MSDSFRSAFSKAVKRAEERQWVYGLLGRKNPDGSFTFDVPGRRGFVYVSIRQSNGAQTVVPARNDDAVPKQPNLGVRMKLEYGVYVIHGRANRADLVNTPDAPEYGVLAHATTHQHGGSDEIATLTPAPFAIPKANASGWLDDWIEDAGYSQEEIEDFVAAQFVGNTGVIDATYNDTTGAITLTLDVSVADRYLYSTGADAWAEGTITSFARGLLDDTDAATMRSTLGLVIGTNVQAYDAELAAIAGLTSAADRLPYFTGSGTAALATFTGAARNLLDDADVATMRTTLGITAYDQETVEDIVGAMVSGNTETDIAVTYDDGTGKLNFVVSATSDHGGLTGLGDNDHPQYVLDAGDTMSGNLIINASLGISQASPQWPVHVTGTSAGAKLVLLTLHNNSNDNNTESAIRFVNRNTSITGEAFRVGELSVMGAGGDGLARMIGRVSNGSTLDAVWSVDNLVFNHDTPVGILLTDPQSPLSVVSLDATLSQNANQIELRSQRTTINAVGEGLIGGISFRSDDDNITAPGRIVAMIQAIATETHGNTQTGTAIRFQMIPNGGTTLATTVTIGQDGVITATGINVGEDNLTRYDAEVTSTSNPALESTGTHPTVGYSTRYWKYSRTNNLCTIQARLQTSSYSGSPTGVAVVKLPFTAHSTGPQVLHGHYRTASTTYVLASFLIDPSTDEALIYNSAGAVDASVLSHAIYVYMAGSYFTA